MFAKPKPNASSQPLDRMAELRRLLAESDQDLLLRYRRMAVDTDNAEAVALVDEFLCLTDLK